MTSGKNHRSGSGSPGDRKRPLDIKSTTNRESNESHDSGIENPLHHFGQSDEFKTRAAACEAEAAQVKTQSNTALGKQGLPNLIVPFQTLALTTATAQISALVFCLTWSIKFNFHESTATHCKVPNYLPSLSATLDFTPQGDVWRSCIGLSGVPRFFIAYMYYKIIYRSKALLLLHWLEVSALIGLSIVDSMKFFAFHATCVGLFLFTSIVHMSLVCTNLINHDASRLGLHTRFYLAETKKVKKRIAVVNFFAIVSALYLYDRHNRLCEPGVYSMFSLLEYIVIVANIVYHLQAYYDLGEYSVTVCREDNPVMRQSMERLKKTSRTKED